MAKETKTEAAVPETPKPAKSKKLLIIIIATVLLLVIVGSVAGLLILKRHNAAADEEGDGSAETASVEKKKAEKEVPPVYVAMDAFTVNLDQDSGGQYLQLALSVEAANIQVGDKIKTATPKIRNNIIRLLSGKKASELITREGKDTLAKEIKDLMNQVIDPEAKGEDVPVKEVLFTAFIIQ